ncbi:MAG: hypothetical protein Q9227_001860 [Pyrenula ochraceoflavens]
MAVTRARPILALTSICLLVGLWSLTHISPKNLSQVSTLNAFRKPEDKPLIPSWGLSDWSSTGSTASEAAQKTAFEGSPSPTANFHEKNVSSPSLAQSQSVPTSAGSVSGDLVNEKSKYAFATFLTGTLVDKDDDDDTHDNYFIAVRMLIYQILHAPETRCKNHIPFVVLVTNEVLERKRERLRKDGAIVKVIEHIHGEGWTHPPAPRWADTLTKLRLWELTEYEKVAFIDGDGILTRPVDGVFEDPATVSMHTGVRPEALLDDEAPLPSNYSFAAITQVEPEHEYPPSEENHGFPNVNYLNAGFMVLQPSIELFNYYLSLTRIPDRFNQDMPEQNL